MSDNFYPIIYKFKFFINYPAWHFTLKFWFSSTNFNNFFTKSWGIRILYYIIFELFIIVNNDDQEFQINLGLTVSHNLELINWKIFYICPYFILFF